MTGLVAYSTKVNGRGTVVIGLGLLDIAERLSWASALALYGAPEIFDSYPKYLAEQIIIRKRNPANIKQPIDMVPSSVAKEARDNKTIKEVRLGLYFGMITYVISHEYAHLEYKHLEKGIRTRTAFPRSHEEALKFQEQEYAADFHAALLLSMLKVPTFTGALVNQYLIHANEIKQDPILAQHPPSYLRSLALMRMGRLDAETLGLNSKDTRRYKDVSKRLISEYALRAYASLGDKRLREGLDKDELNYCMRKRSNGCIRACLVYGHSRSKCKKKFCASKQQSQHDLVLCHLDQRQ
ncbi:hypothetical protein A3196_15425 [Candidatus Thiodiazotropha endoloripes]|uniref:Uncharacterized protein n=2 Tax=Candidatus Thiodiazotropha endoloripes TaxID=1818881 RepID=A0A1E2UU13_9GAMM|nr:hypothetical protein A3196_15425 [Candidatus Thiodiazotropha endoloripes]